jgi:beta-phosphoglucomutase
VGIITTRVFPATFFDYNGVLVDDEAVHCAAMRAAVRPLQVTFTDRDYWERYLGFDDVGAFDAILRDAGLPAEPRVIAELVEAKGKLYLDAARAQLQTFDGADALVTRLARTGPVGVVSGALRHEIELGLALLGVTDSVCCIVAAEDTTLSKPAPEGYEIAKRRLRELGHAAAAERALVVEDSMAGVEAARAAGLPCLAVAHTYPAERLLAAGADLIAESVATVTDQMLQELYTKLYG